MSDFLTSSFSFVTKKPTQVAVKTRLLMLMCPHHIRELADHINIKERVRKR